jgi:hypothetical protein
MLWLASLLIVFALLTAPNRRPASFLFFIVTVDYPLSRVFSFNAPNAFLSVRDKAEIGNSLNNARLAVSLKVFFSPLLGIPRTMIYAFLSGRLRNACVARGLRIFLCYDCRRNDRISLYSSIPS